VLVGQADNLFVFDGMLMVVRGSMVCGGREDALLNMGTEECPTRLWTL